MSFGSEVKVRSDGVFEKLNEQIAGQEKRHGANDGFGSGPTAKIQSPNAEGLRHYLQEDGSKHEPGAECYQILQKALAKAVCARLYEHKSADKVCGCRQHAKEQERDKASGIKIHCLVWNALVSPKT